MNEIYPMWVAAHGIIIIAPVHWYQSPTVLKLMMDRMVCADGGNPDPTSTHGKDAARAKELEAGWKYPRHLKGRGHRPRRQCRSRRSSADAHRLADRHALEPGRRDGAARPVHCTTSRTQRATLSWTATARSSLKQEMQP